MKKAFCVLLSMVFIINMSGCSLLPFGAQSSDEKVGVDDMLLRGWQKDESKSSNKNATSTSLKESSQNGITRSDFYGDKVYNLCYESLSTQAEKDCYNKIKEEVYNIQPQANADGNYPIETIEILNTELNQETIQRIVVAYRNDNPEVFWVVNLFGYELKDKNTYINLFSSLPLNKCTDAVNEMNSTINEIISAAPEGLSEYDIEKYVYNWIIDNCKYDTTVKDSSDKWQAFTSYGAIVGRNAVCEGYSRALQLLLSNMGIECMLSNGYTNQVPHMWNIVNIGGEYYHLDATFDNSSQMKLYDYFNLSDEQIQKDHIIDPSYDQSTNSVCYTSRCTEDKSHHNFNIPKCTHTDANYFQVEGIKISSLDEKNDNIAINALISLAQKKAESAPFLISDNFNYQEAISKMLFKPPYKLLYYVNEANERLDGDHQIDSEKLIYVESGIQKAFVLKLTYK